VATSGHPFVPPAARAARCHRLLPRSGAHDRDAAASPDPILAANYSEAQPQIDLLTGTTTLPLSCLEIPTAFKVTSTSNIHSYITFVSPPSTPYFARETPDMHEVATGLYNSQFSSPNDEDFCESPNYEALMKNTRSAREAGPYCPRPQLSPCRLHAMFSPAWK